MLTNDDLQQIGKLLEPLNTRLSGVEKNLATVKSDVKKVKKDVSVLIRSTNRDDMHVMKRVERIEHHLGLPPLH
jgi:hypothetical protein